MFAESSDCVSPIKNVRNVIEHSDDAVVVILLSYVRQQYSLVKLKVTLYTSAPPEFWKVVL